MKKNDQVEPQLLWNIIRKASHPLKLDDILRHANLSRKVKKEVLDVLHTLAEQGKLVRMKGGSWAAGENLRTITGRFAVQRSGAAFVVPEAKGNSKGSQDIYIATHEAGKAWNGDIVEVLVMPTRPGRSPEGRVIRVVRRGNTELTVRVLQHGGINPVRKKQRQTPGERQENASATSSIMARPADSRLDFDVLVDVSGLDSIPQPGELLRVQVDEEQGLLESPYNTKLYAAVALTSLGREDDVKVQETLTKLNHLIPMEFPDDVMAEAEAVAQKTPVLEAGMEDLRSLNLVTIDGADARDFDDAVYVEKVKEGWRLVVAIADVSYYVRPRSGLDREAGERANSYYFPASVEPMLPESLSNGICSLRPQEDRRVMVVDITLDAYGKPVHSRCYAALMRSQARLTYEQVQACLDSVDAANTVDTAAQKMPQGIPGVSARAEGITPGINIGGSIRSAPSAKDEKAPSINTRSASLPLVLDDIPPVDPALQPMLCQAAALASILMERRKKQGGLDFDMPEAAFVVEDGLVKGMRNRERLFSHRLIEAFMVEANEAVATFLTRKNADLLYRIHPSPNPEKLESLARSLGDMGLDLPLPPAKKSGDPGWIPGLLRAASGTGRAWLVDSLVLRSMMQARYDPELDIHFGLASQCYCHFTSPIRRYADLVTHRALRHALGLDAGGKILAAKKLEAIADVCNGRERAAQEAEREITRRLGCLLLRDQTGREFGGLISGVTHFGLFIQLEGLSLEGMIRVEELGDEYFLYDQERHEMTGQQSGRSFRLGDSLKVRLADVHVGRLEINLALVDAPYSGTRKRRSPSRPSRTSKASRYAKPEGREKSSDHKKRQAYPKGRTYGKKRG